MLNSINFRRFTATHSISKDTAAEREKHQRKVQEYLKAGGKITVCPPCTHSAGHLGPKNKHQKKLAAGRTANLPDEAA